MENLIDFLLVVLLSGSVSFATAFTVWNAFKRALKEFGDAIVVVSDSIADDKIDKNELDNIRKGLNEFFEETIKFWNILLKVIKRG